MALVIADRVLEQSTTAGTGVFTLAGASLGYRSFASVCSVSDTVWYYIEAINALGQPLGDYEYGLGTYSAANQLTRTTVLGSSNGGAAVNFAAGTKLVGITPLAPSSAQMRTQWRAALFASDDVGVSARLGVGTLSPASALDVQAATGEAKVTSSTGTNFARAVIANGSGSIHVGIEDSAGAEYGLPAYSRVLWSSGAYLLALGTNGLARYYIDSTGQHGMGVTPSANTRLSVKGNGTTSGSWCLVTTNDAGTTLLSQRDDGALYTGLAASSPYNFTSANAANAYLHSDGYLYRSTSSRRYKTNIAQYLSGLAKAMTLRPVTFQSRDEVDAFGSQSAPMYGGFIAEDLHDVGLTEFVLYDEQGRPDAVHYANMVALLASAIQEQQAQIAALQAAIGGKAK